MHSEITIPASLCEEVMALLPDYILQLTTTEEGQLIEALLPFCPDVRAALDDYRVIGDGLLRIIPSAGSPPPVETLFARIAQEDRHLTQNSTNHAFATQATLSIDKPISTPADGSFSGSYSGSYSGSLLRHTAQNGTSNSNNSTIKPTTLQSAYTIPATAATHESHESQPIKAPVATRKTAFTPGRQALTVAALLLCLIGFNVYWVVRIAALQGDLQSQQLALLTQLNGTGSASAATLQGVGDQYRKLAVTRPDMEQVQAVFTWNTFNRVGALYITGMPPLDSAHTYQLWLVDPNEKAQSLGIFQSDSVGNAVLIFQSADDLARYKHIGVSIEPNQGSLNPTTPHIVLGDL